MLGNNGPIIDLPTLGTRRGCISQLSTRDIVASKPIHYSDPEYYKKLKAATVSKYNLRETQTLLRYIKI